MDLWGSGWGSANGSANGSEEANSTCYSLDTAPKAALVLHATILSVILLFSLAGNGLVLVLVIAYKRLKTRSVIISMSVVVADVLYTLFYTLPTLVTTINGGWAFGRDGCIAVGFLASAIVSIRWFIVGLLCTDRFCTIYFPFSYNKPGKRRKILNVVFTSIAWIVPIVASLIPIHIFADFEVRQNIPICLPTCTHRSLPCQIYYTVVFTITYIIGSIIPMILYCCLYNKARRLKKSAKHKIGHYTVRIASGVLVTQPIGEYPKQSRENQATMTFVLIFVTVVLTGTPGYLLQLVRSISLQLHCAIPIVIHFIVMDIFLSAPMLTPLVLMRDRNFRACLSKLFCCGKKTSDFPGTQERRGSSLEPKSFCSVSQSRRSSIAAPQESSNDKRPNGVPPALAVYTITESCESELCAATTAPSTPS